MLVREKSVTGTIRGLSVVSKNTHNTATRTFGTKFLNDLNSNMHLKQKNETQSHLVVGQKENIPPKTSAHEEQNMNKRSSKYNRKQYEQLRFLPRGLINIGNTCYMNSTLQCLFHLKYFSSSFIEQIMTHNHQLPSVTHYSGNALKSMLKKGDPLELRKLKQSIELKEPMFKGYSQQDAQQFLTKLLQILNKQLTRVNKKFQYKQLDGDPSKKTINLLSDQWWSYSLKRQNSIICDVFQGQFISTIKCSNCRKTSVNFDNFRGFPITLAKNANVYDLLTKQLSTQKLGEDYCCPGCKKDKCCNKLIEIFRLPKILVIQLKRFKSQAQQFAGFSSKKTKINSAIKIDSTLNIEHLLNKNASLQQSSYKLKGIVHHYGKLAESGHYIAEVYVNALEKWYIMNDKQTFEVNFSPISETAYLLFYEQCN